MDAFLLLQANGKSQCCLFPDLIITAVNVIVTDIVKCYIHQTCEKEFFFPYENFERFCKETAVLLGVKEKNERNLKGYRSEIASQESKF